MAAKAGRKSARSTAKSKAAKSKAGKTARTSDGARRGAARSTTADRIIDAALDCAAESGWARLTLPRIAERAGLPLHELRANFSGKASILAAYLRRVDLDVLTALEGAEPFADEPARDRLFEVLMRRIEAITPAKAAIAAIAGDLPRDPATLACTLPLELRSMQWMLTAAGLPSSGPFGRLSAKALAAAWAVTMRAWFRDDDPDLGRTMATLDRQLGRLDRLAGLCRGGRLRASRRAEAAA